eukprot:10052_1
MTSNTSLFLIILNILMVSSEIELNIFMTVLSPTPLGSGTRDLGIVEYSGGTIKWNLSDEIEEVIDCNCTVTVGGYGVFDRLHGSQVWHEDKWVDLNTLPFGGVYRITILYHVDEEFFMLISDTNNYSVDGFSQYLRHAIPT